MHVHEASLSWNTWAIRADSGDVEEKESILTPAKIKTRRRSRRKRRGSMMWVEGKKKGEEEQEEEEKKKRKGRGRKKKRMRKKEKRKKPLSKELALERSSRWSPSSVG